MQNLVSICCLSYNHARFIEQAVKSFWEQDYKNIEILALDDGSSDNSLEVLNDLKAKSPCPMEVYGQVNSGNIPKNFNFLMKKARGKYVAIISLDDMFLKNAIAPKIDLMENDENIQFVFNTRFLNTNFNTGESFEEILRLDKVEDITAQNILDEDFYRIHSYYIQGTVYRKSLLETVGYFDEDMIADDIVLRTKTAKYIKEHPEYKIGVLKESAVNYRIHDTNVSRNLALQLKSIALFYQRYYPNKRRMRTLKNGFRGLLKQHKFKEALELYKEFSLYRDFTYLIPFWLLGVGFKALCNCFKQNKIS